MNNFFENQLEEIHSISNRSKKEKKKTFTRLQKANSQFVESINSKIINCYTKCIEGINVHQFTKDGKAIIGSSDRVYLPDVATRLYQNVENISLSYKSHKFHSNENIPNTFSKGTSDIRYYDYSQNNNNDVKKFLLWLYGSLEKSIQDEFNVSFSVEKIYSIWSLYNDDGEYSEFDETSTYLEYRFITKRTNEIIANGIIELPVDFNFLYPNDIDELEYVKNILKRLVKLEYIDKEKVNPKFLYLDSLSSCMLFEKDMYANNIKNTERFDKFGNPIQGKNEEITNQIFYFQRPRETGNNFLLNTEGIKQNDKDISLDSESGDKYLYAFHSRTNNFDSDKSIQPGALLYFDGNKLYRVKADILDLSEVKPEDINVSTEDRNVTKVKENSRISLAGIKNAIVKFTKSIKIL